MLHTDRTLRERDAEYKEDRHCPCCHSGDLEPGHTEHGETGITQTMSCADCGATWDEVYELVGVTNVRRST
jgi:hypothetical protein